MSSICLLDLFVVLVSFLLIVTADVTGRSPMLNSCYVVFRVCWPIENATAGCFHSFTPLVSSMLC